MPEPITRTCKDCRIVVNIRERITCPQCGRLVVEYVKPPGGCQS